MFTWSLDVHVVEKSHQTITERIRDGRDVSGLFNMKDVCVWILM